jgi:uncharacterized protein (DUF305 family)
MKYLPFFVFLMFMPAAAGAHVEPSYQGAKPTQTTPWYGLANPAARQNDLDFIRGMRPHHEGALTMSQEYLANKNASNSRLMQLAHGIIRNQTFEIDLFNHMESVLKNHGVVDRVATQGRAAQQRFIYSPMPGFVFRGDTPHTTSKRDVEFAKAMIVHHHGALDMCKDYLDDAATDNEYLELLCLDIQFDQSQEIALMQDIIGDYAGNAGDVKITPSMVHGMDHMKHGKKKHDHKNCDDPTLCPPDGAHHH